jgi:AcrR family transcriptional regulator
MTRPHRTTPTPDRILAAAARVVLRNSVRRLTLEAVAREAQLSKGGVFYHFATKEALIQAMLARLLQSCARELEGPQQDAAPGRWTRVYVRRTCAPVGPIRETLTFRAPQRWRQASSWRPSPTPASSIRCERAFRPGSRRLRVTASIPCGPRSCAWRPMASGSLRCSGSGPPAARCGITSCTSS